MVPGACSTPNEPVVSAVRCQLQSLSQDTESCSAEAVPVTMCLSVSHEIPNSQSWCPCHSTGILLSLVTRLGCKTATLLHGQSTVTNVPQDTVME